MNEIYAYIQAHKNEILAAQRTGDVLARTIVTTHEMMVRHPDHIAEAILEMSVKDWQARAAVSRRASEADGRVRGTGAGVVG